MRESDIHTGLIALCDQVIDGSCLHDFTLVCRHTSNVDKVFWVLIDVLDCECFSLLVLLILLKRLNVNEFMLL